MGSLPEMRPMRKWLFGANPVHPFELMSKEQLDAVKEQILSEENSDLRKIFFKASLEDAEKCCQYNYHLRGREGLQLDESPDDVIDYIGNIDREDIDVELTPEMLSTVS